MSSHESNTPSLRRKIAATAVAVSLFGTGGLAALKLNDNESPNSNAPVSEQTYGDPAHPIDVDTFGQGKQMPEAQPENKDQHPFADPEHPIDVDTFGR